MSPDKALELVGRYARLTRQIKDCSKRIGDAIEKCCGLSGFRGSQEWLAAASGFDDKGRDKDVHLWHWYQPKESGNEYSGPYLVWPEPGEDEAAECPHCWAAHLAVQERKQARRQLAAVRGAMSRAKA